MYQFAIGAVGDGLCSFGRTAHNQIIQVDWGGSGSLGTSASCRVRHLFGGEPRHFILSHFHSDHYEGLLAATTDPAQHSWPLECVYFPVIPKIDGVDPKAFFFAMLAVNAFVMGQSSGYPAWDLTLACQSLAHRRVRWRPLAQGDKLEIGGSYITVLWPPRKIDSDSVSAKVRTFIEDTEKAVEADSDFKQLHKTISETVSFEDTMLGFHEPVFGNRNPDLKFAFKEKRRVISEAVEEAHRSLRLAANALSVCFLSDLDVLFFGDLDKDLVPNVVEYAIQRLPQTNHRLSSIIPPHHGTSTHFHSDILSLTAQVVLVSNGPQRFKTFSEEYLKVGPVEMTYLRGDIYYPCNRRAFETWKCRACWEEDCVRMGF